MSVSTTYIGLTSTVATFSLINFLNSKININLMKTYKEFARYYNGTPEQRAMAMEIIGGTAEDALHILIEDGVVKTRIEPSSRNELDLVKVDINLAHQATAKRAFKCSVPESRQYKIGYVEALAPTEAQYNLNLERLKAKDFTVPFHTDDGEYLPYEWLEPLELEAVKEKTSKAKKAVSAKGSKGGGGKRSNTKLTDTNRLLALTTFIASMQVNKFKSINDYKDLARMPFVEAKALLKDVPEDAVGFNIERTEDGVWYGCYTNATEEIVKPPVDCNLFNQTNISKNFFDIPVADSRKYKLSPDQLFTNSKVGYEALTKMLVEKGYAIVEGETFKLLEFDVDIQSGGRGRSAGSSKSVSGTISKAGSDLLERVFAGEKANAENPVDSYAKVRGDEYGSSGGYTFFEKKENIVQNHLQWSLVISSSKSCRFSIVGKEITTEYKISQNQMDSMTRIVNNPEHIGSIHELKDKVREIHLINYLNYAVITELPSEDKEARTTKAKTSTSTLFGGR